MIRLARLAATLTPKVAGKCGIEEVNVNAMDGTIVGVEHESPADESNEAAAGKKAVKKP
jgi:hypothetical protein